MLFFVRFIALFVLFTGRLAASDQVLDVDSPFESRASFAGEQCENSVVCDQRCIYRGDGKGFATQCRGIDTTTGVTIWRNEEKCVPDGPFQCAQCSHLYLDKYTYFYSKEGHFAALGSGSNSMEACNAIRAKDPKCQ